MKVSAHFTLAELSRSDYAARKGVDNTPPPEVIENLKVLCEVILEPLRAAVEAPIRVNSAYRSPLVNKAIGGNPKGQHPAGQAADIEVYGLSNLDLAKKIVEMKLPFDQLILEAYVPGVAGSGWVHVSHKKEGKNRGQVLTATPVKGKMVYSTGLPQG